MRCYQCGGTYLEKSDLFELVDPYVGPISVQGIPYFKCNQCDDVLFTAEMAQALEDARNKRKQELLNQFPIGDFVCASETAALLDISRQALHKNRRIRRGFIHQITFGGAIVYLRKSVIMFESTGDGRFPLYTSARSIPSVSFEHFLSTSAILYKSTPVSISTEHIESRFVSGQTKLEGNRYDN